MEAYDYFTFTQIDKNRLGVSFHPNFRPLNMIPYILDFDGIITIYYENDEIQDCRFIFNHMNEESIIETLMLYSDDIENQAYNFCMMLL